MGKIWDVEVGHVTNRRGARLHLVIAGGRSYCQSGSGVIIRSRKAAGADAPHVCKRCRKALHARLVDVRNIRSRRAAPGYDLYGDPGNAAIINGCDALLDGLMTPDERAERDAIIDGIRRNLTVSCGIATTPNMTTSPESDDQTTLF